MEEIINRSLRVVGGTDAIHEPPAKELAMHANELFAHIGETIPDSQFKENLLSYLSKERTVLITMMVEEHRK